MIKISPYPLALAFTALLFLPALHAQDFFNGGVSARTAASAGIYVADGQSALDALSLNPAGLAAIGGPVAEVSLAGLLARGSFSDSANPGSPMRWNAGLAPSAAFASPLAHSRWTLAAGILPDLLSSSKWQFQDAPGSAGANYGRQHEQSAILAYRLPVGVAYRLTSRIAIGATAGAVYNANTLVMPYVFQSHPALQGLKTLLDLHTHGFGWNTGVGVVATPSHALQIEASYRFETSITSTGSASGNLNAQFAALHIPFPSAFAYRAQVHVQEPQAVIVGASWRQSPLLRLSAQTSWTGWNGSFHNLPVSLSAGANSAINTLLHSSSLQDTVPLDWKDQWSYRVAAERSLAERISVSAGFVHANNPVPSSTLSPLTAAIMSNGLATGVGYRTGRSRFDLAYQFNFSNQQTVGTSALLSGEFSNSRVKIGTQALTLSSSFHF